ncbi:MAG: ParA family protein [Bacteroidota bacterium]
MSVVNQKGGTGKTTTTLNLGAALANLDQKVLLLDIDPQGSLSYSLGVTDPAYEMTDLLEGRISAEQSIIDIPKENLHLVPSSLSLADLELNLVQLENRINLLGDAIALLDDYDYIIIDCPPALSLLTLNALATSKFAIIPLQLEVLSARGLDQILGSIERINKSLDHDLEVMGVLPVMVDGRKRLSSEVYDYITNSYDVPVFESKVRVNVRISEAPSFAQSVMSYSPKSNGCADYKALAKEILNYQN